VRGTPISDLQPLAQVPNLQIKMEKGEVRDAYRSKRAEVLAAQWAGSVEFCGKAFTIDAREPSLDNLNPMSVGCRDAQADLSPLSRFARLKTLSLETQARDLSAISELAMLSDLSLNLSDKYGQYPALNLAVLGQSLQLTDLRIEDGAVTGLDSLASLGRLEELYIRGNGSPVGELEWLASLWQLRELGIRNAGVQSVDALSVLIDLQELDLQEGAIADIQALGGMKRLRELNLGDNPIKEIGPLHALSELKELSLRNTKVQDLSPLRGLQRLRKLNIFGVPATDLAPLYGLSQLAVLQVGDAVSDDAIADLKKRLPKLDVRRGRGW